jgi:hypothetical protein
MSQDEAPPEVVAVRVTIPPTHTFAVEGFILMEGSGEITMEAVFDVATVQPAPEQVYVAL